mmetsp:Transcript_40353/g.52881  ORF Transcript_40353/g.52881 Transcript_40353/m.52881 type:complete len:91 (+) Transcript_40353:946-1218(+)
MEFGQLARVHYCLAGCRRFLIRRRRERHKHRLLLLLLLLLQELDLAGIADVVVVDLRVARIVLDDVSCARLLLPLQIKGHLDLLHVQGDA